MSYSLDTPCSWALGTLADAVELIRGISFPSAEKAFAPADGLVCCLRTTNVQRTVTLDDVWYVPAKYVRDNKQIVQLNDILISTANSLALVGKVAQVTELRTKTTLGAFISALRPSTALNPHYVYYQLAAGDYQELIRQTASTTTNISNISTQRILDLPFKVAPIGEQERIVSQIETLLTDLDAAVAALKRVQANLKRYRASVLKSACEGRLVPTEAELARKEGRTYETGEQLLARILHERRAKWEADQLTKMLAAGKPPKGDDWKKKYKEPTPPDASDLPNPPEGWAWCRFDQVCFSQNGRPFPSSEYCEVGVRLIRPGNLHISGRVEWNSENTRFMPARWQAENDDLVVGPGELVMNLTAQSLKDEFLGRVCMTGLDENCLLNQRLARLTPIGISPRFLLWVLKSQLFRRFVDTLNTGSLIQHMFTSQLANFHFLLPPTAEQTRIIEALDEQISAIESTQSAAETTLARAERLRQAILKRAFEGKLVPQEPNDEPASVLLERIRAERAARDNVSRQPSKNRDSRRAVAAQKGQP